MKASGSYLLIVFDIIIVTALYILIDGMYFKQWCDSLMLHQDLFPLVNKGFSRFRLTLSLYASKRWLFRLFDKAINFIPVICITLMTFEVLSVRNAVDTYLQMAQQHILISLIFTIGVYVLYHCCGRIVQNGSFMFYSKPQDEALIQGLGISAFMLLIFLTFSDFQKKRSKKRRKNKKSRHRRRRTMDSFFDEFEDASSVAVNETVFTADVLPMTEHDSISYNSPFESFERSEIIFDPDPMASKSILDIANSPLSHYRDPIYEMPLRNSICLNCSYDFGESFSMIGDQSNLSYQNRSSRISRQVILAKSEDKEIIEEANNAIIEISRTLTEDEISWNACETISSSFSRSRDFNYRSVPPQMNLESESLGIAEIYDNKDQCYSLESVGNPSFVLNRWDNRRSLGLAGYGAIESSALSWSDESDSTRWSPSTAEESESDRYFVYADDSSSVHTEINPLETDMELFFRRPNNGKSGGDTIDLKEHNRRLHVAFVLEQLCERVQIRIEKELGFNEYVNGDVDDDDKMSEVSRSISPYPELTDFDLRSHSDEFFGSPGIHSKKSNSKSVHYIYDHDYSCSDELSGSPFSCRQQIYEIVIDEGENEMFDCRFSFELNGNNENVDDNGSLKKEVNISDLSWRTQSFNERDPDEHSLAFEDASFCATPILHEHSRRRWSQSSIESSGKNSFVSLSKYFDYKSVERLDASVDESLMSCLNEAEQLFAKDPVCRDLFSDELERSISEDYDNEIDCELTPRLYSCTIHSDGDGQSEIERTENFEPCFTISRNGFVSCSNFFDLFLEDEDNSICLDEEQQSCGFVDWKEPYEVQENYSKVTQQENACTEEELDAVDEGSEIDCDLTPRIFSNVFERAEIDDESIRSNESEALVSTLTDEYSYNYELLSTSNYFDYALESINSNIDCNEDYLITEYEEIEKRILLDINSSMSSRDQVSDDDIEVDSEMTPRLSQRFVDEDESDRPMLLCGVSVDTGTLSMYLPEITLSLDDINLAKQFMEDDFFPENTYSLTIDTGGSNEENTLIVDSNYALLDTNNIMMCGINPRLTKWFLDSSDADKSMFVEVDKNMETIPTDCQNRYASPKDDNHHEILSLSNFFDFPSDEEGSIDSHVSFAIKVLELDDSWRYQGMLKKSEKEEDGDDGDRADCEEEVEEDYDCEITPRLSRYTSFKPEGSEASDDIHDADIFSASSEEFEMFEEAKSSQEYFDDQQEKFSYKCGESPSSNDEVISVYKMSPSSNFFKDFCADDVTGVSSSKSDDKHEPRSSFSSHFSSFSFSGSPDFGGKKSLSEKSMIQRAQAYLSPSALMKLSPERAIKHLKKKFRRKKSKADDSEVVMPIGERRRLKILDSIPSMSVLLKAIRDEKR